MYIQGLGDSSVLGQVESHYMSNRIYKILYNAVQCSQAFKMVRHGYTVVNGGMYRFSKKSDIHPTHSE